MVAPGPLSSIVVGFSAAGPRTDAASRAQMHRAGYAKLAALQRKERPTFVRSWNRVSERQISGVEYGNWRGCVPFFRIQKVMRGSLRNTLVALALLATWLVFAAWQYHEFGHERKREQTDLMRQSEVLRQALLGGASAHRRLGRVFEEQMQAVFDEITETSGVIAVRLEAVGEGIVMNAGENGSAQHH